MNNFIERDSLEIKLKRISLIPPSTDPINHETITPPKPYPMNLTIVPTILFIIGFIVILTSTGLVRAYQSDKVVQSLFTRFKIKKTSQLGGLIVINNEKELKVNWSNKGYFIFTYEDKPIAFAESSEIYWKILYLHHKFSQVN